MANAYIESEFTRLCGPSVLYKRHEHTGRRLRIVYTIPAISEDERAVAWNLRNGLRSVMLAAVRQLAGSARDDAYRRTGHREADMQQLLSGRTV